MSYLNSNTKLLEISESVDSLDLVFNSYIFSDVDEKEILEEVIYTISLSVKDNYDVIYGSYSLKKEDLILVVDSKNRVDANVLKVLGYNSKDDITFDKILNKEFKVALNNDYYNYNGINYEVNDYGDIYNKS